MECVIKQLKHRIMSANYGNAKNRLLCNTYISVAKNGINHKQVNRSLKGNQSELSVKPNVFKSC